MDMFNFPIVTKVYAKSLASQLIPVKPIGISEEELREIRRREEIRKRNKKINKILDKIKKGE